MKTRMGALIISALLVLTVVLLCVKYCGRPKEKSYTAVEFEAYKKTQEDSAQQYRDSLNFIRGQMELQQEEVFSKQENVWRLEKSFDSLYNKHQQTKKKVKPIPDNYLSDTGFVLAPNDYINECEECFKNGMEAKKENAQLKFERDAFDNLFRAQGRIDSNRIAQLSRSNNFLSKKVDTLLARNELRRKVKISAIGMYSDPFLLGGGGGLIYEDKKENLFGGHVIFSNKGKIYLFNYAKTISLRRKKK